MSEPIRLSVMTNLTLIADVCPPGVEVTLVPRPRQQKTLAARLSALWAAARCDYVLINCSPMELFELSLVRALVPFARSRVISLDTVLPIPRTDTFRQRVTLAVKRWLFRHVHLFIEYFKDTRGYERHYGIPADRFRYVPFKINRYEQVLRTATRDDGYVFCGGNTRRDFRTLLEAARRLPYPFRIVTMADAVIAKHGSELDASQLPPNVTVVRHDGSDSFLDYIAAAHVVALPIRKGNISASGIGVYLASMALGKCVVISSGPAVDGVVPEGAAVIVPPEDPAALEAAIRRTFEDDAFRAGVAEKGRAYAHGLKGEHRLCESVLGVLLQDQASSR